MLCYSLFCLFLWFFFFKQKTAYELRISDWSSDVCSSDLVVGYPIRRSERLAGGTPREDTGTPTRLLAGRTGGPADARAADRSSEIGRASCRERVCQYV